MVQFYDKASVYLSFIYTVPNPCVLEEPCDPKAECFRLGLLNNDYQCVCKTGFAGDGFLCLGKLMGSCQTLIIMVKMWLYLSPSLQYSVRLFLYLSVPLIQNSLVSGLNVDILTSTKCKWYT